MRRRRFIQCAGLAVASGINGLPPSGFAQQRTHRKELNADLIVIGGGIGGCAAALAAVRNGRRVILTEETDWIGGQLTQQAVPPDEHPWIEIFGATRSYREFRSQIRDYYYRNYPLTPQAGSRRALNPGNGSVSKLCHEPRVALASSTFCQRTSVDRAQTAQGRFSRHPFGFCQSCHGPQSRLRR